jgi:hypothetical protein
MDASAGFEIHRLLPRVVLNGSFDEKQRKTGQVGVDKQPIIVPAPVFGNVTRANGRLSSGSR